MLNAAVIQTVQERLPWHVFLKSRLINKQWYTVSFLSIAHWYGWLQTKGKQVFSFNRGDHDHRHCDEFDAGVQCVNHHHYAKVMYKPKLLKTVPLSTQVMQQILKKKQRHFQCKLDREVAVKIDIEQQMQQNKARMLHIAQEFDCLKKMQVTHAVKRRRTHIEPNISK